MQETKLEKKDNNKSHQSLHTCDQKNKNKNKNKNKKINKIPTKKQYKTTNEIQKAKSK